MSLIDFPLYIKLAFVKEWLSILEIGKLEASLTVKHKESLTELFSRLDNSTPFEYYKSKSFVAWILSRSIVIRKFAVCDNIFENMEHLQTVSSKLTNVTHLQLNFIEIEYSNNYLSHFTKLE